MPLYTGHGLEGEWHSVVGHLIWDMLFVWWDLLTSLLHHATLSESGPIRACSYIRDNTLVTYSGTLKTPIPRRPAVLVDSGMPI